MSTLYFLLIKKVKDIFRIFLKTQCMHLLGVTQRASTSAPLCETWMSSGQSKTEIWTWILTWPYLIFFLGTYIHLTVIHVHTQMLLLFPTSLAFLCSPRCKLPQHDRLKYLPLKSLRRGELRRSNSNIRLWNNVNKQINSTMLKVARFSLSH